MRRLAPILMAGVVLILLAGCRGSEESTGGPSAQALTASPTPLPASGGSAVLQPESGGVITLSDGAEVSVPPQVLSQATLVSLRAANSHPDVPLPRTSLGPAYEISLDGANLNGVAVLKLPLPEGIAPEDFDIGAYRWNERTWERVSGRLVGDSVQIASENPGLFALQGTWKLASAALGLTLPPGGLQPGTNSVPFTLTGKYRFDALPAIQRGYTPVHLALKRDTSGGAGQVTGNVSLDETVSETTLWFQPDPGQSRGEIEFQHVFEIPLGEIDLVPGSTSRYYAVFRAEDSPAPTSELSSGVDYTHVLPIRIVGRDVVRPELTRGAGRPLQWHIRLNGQTWLQIPSDRSALPMEEILAKGGIGDYSVTLETQSQGKWVTASNEVTVKLAPPPTETPIWTETPQATAATVELPGLTTPTPAGTAPPTPTRRPRPALSTPEGTSAVSPTPTTSVTPAATATRTAGEQVFWADSYTIITGGCTVLHWKVENVIEVYLDGTPVTGVESKQVCPTQSTTYVLRAVTPNGSQERRVTIAVGTAADALIEFTADAYQVAKGACTTLHWRAENVQAVYLNGEGVAGVDSKSVCPQVPTTYTLRVVSKDGTSASRSLTIAVLGESGVPLHFWADQYTMSPGACTTLHWSVDGVQAVYVGVTGKEQGVSGAGSTQVCPVGEVSYTMRITTTDESSDSKQLILLGEDPSMGSNEVIAQALVQEVVRTTDVNSSTSGQQPGWNVVLSGIDVLFSGESNWDKDTATLRLPQALVQQQAVFGVPIDWPINAGQLIEFRAICEGAECSLDAGPPRYLHLRSP
jgi:hypothetical protein